MEMEERIDETFDKMNGTPGAMKDAIVLEKISADIDKDDVKLDKPDIPTTVIDEKIKSIELPKVDATNVPLKDDETPTALQNSDSMKSEGIFVESAPKHPEDTPLESKTLKSEETKPANTSQIGEDVDSVPSTPTNTVTLDGEAIKKVLNVDEVCETEKETANTDVVCESVEDVVNSNALSETVNQKTIAGNIGKDDDEENASIIADSSPIKGSDITIISATSEDDVSDGMEVDPTEDESEVNESKEDADIIEDESEPEDDYDSENVSETHDMSEDDNDEDDEEDYDDMDVKEDFVSSGAKKMYRAPRSLLIKLRNRSIVWLNKSQAKKADRMHAMDVAHPTTAADTYTTILPIQSTFKPSTTNEIQENAKPIDVLEQSSPVGNIPSTSDSIAIGAAAAALFPDGVVSENVIGLAAVLQSTQNAVAAIISNAPTTNGNQVDDNKDNSDDVMEISMDVSDDTVTNNNEQIEFTEGSVAPPEVSNVVPIAEADIAEIIEATPEPKDPEKTVSSKRKAQTLSPTLEEKSEKKVKIAEVKIVNNVEMTFNEENAKNEVERQPQDILEKEAAVEENEAKKIEEKQEETKGEKKENEKIVTTEVNIVPTTNKAEEVKDLKSNLHDDVQAPAPTSLSSKKRPRSPSSNGIESPQISNIEDTEEVPPTKKLCAELQSNFANFHERLLTEYIETTPNNTMDDIQFNVNSLIREIQALNDMIREKELEWNNMLYLKKVKEELVVRLTRKKQVMEIMSSRIGEVTDYSITDVQVPLSLGKKATKELQSSIVSNQANCGAVTMMPIMSTSTANSSTGIQNTLKNIVQRRANMNSSELTKAKGSLEKVRRLLISRNILPKPMSGSPSTSTPTSTAVAPSVSATPLVSVSQTYNQIMAQPISNANNLNNQSTASILNTYMQSGGSMAELNGHHQQMQQMGRQGAIKDVKSIIAEHRQQHPETVPRRGRRLKNNWERNVDKSSLLSELSYLLTKNDGNSRPSSADSSHSNSNQLLPNLSGGIQTTSTPNQSANQSFQDALLQFAKLNDHRNSNNAASNLLCSLNVQQSAASKSSASPSTAIGGNTHQQQSQQALYPEVTLHPVSSQQQNISSELPTSASSTVVSHGGIQMPQGVNNQAHSSSLLHGILTKSQSRPSPAFVSSFSPTLARLLTAPERITTPANNYPSQTTGINLSKSHSEITITPVVHSHQQQNLQQTLMQQRQQDCINLSRGGDNGNVKSEMFMSIDDEADDSADRLVIDESDSGANENSTKVTGQEFHENEVPECQGCKKREAQFVCAGCGNQWYCSRDCQVSAWDEHSEVCTG